MAADKYEVEEDRGGYVRNGDVLEWRWKQTPDEPAAEKKKPAKKPEGAPKKP